MSVSEREYVRGFEQINQMLREGKSFSGRERNCFFLNTGSGKFADVSAISGFDWKDDCRAVATVDWDFDGRTDVWVSNRTGPNTRFLRNRIRTENHFVAFRLAGNGLTTSRDAVGARIEVVLNDDAGVRRIKTVKAGDGFQSQSTRWIKFGLGDQQTIDHIDVHWPGGGSQSFDGVAVDKWYLLSQESANASQWIPPAIELDRIPSSPPLEKPSSAARTLLANPIPIPNMSFGKFSGEVRTLTGDQKALGRADESGGTLVVLWATWCPHCLEEMKELQAQHSEIKAAGIEVVALCVDALGDERGETADKAKIILSELKLTFSSGPATPQIMEMLHLIDEYVFDQPRSLPVPASFLLNSQSCLAGIYKGPVTVEQLLNDVKTLDGSPDERLAAAVPFGGIWSAPVPETDFTIILSMLDDSRHVDETGFYLQQLMFRYPSSVEICARVIRHLLATRKTTEAIELVTNKCTEFPDESVFTILLADLYLNDGRAELAEQTLRPLLDKQPENSEALLRVGHSFNDRDKLEKAAEFYRKAAAADENLIEARIELASVLEKSGQADEAVLGLMRAIESHPEVADYHLVVAEILMHDRKLEQAIEHFRKCIELNSEVAAAHFQLARCLEQTGNAADADKHYESAAQLDPRNPLLLNQWGIVLARRNEIAEAASYFRTALEIDPDYRAAAENLERAEQMMDPGNATGNAAGSSDESGSDETGVDESSNEETGNDKTMNDDKDK